MFVGALIQTNISHPDDYRKRDICAKGIVLKESGTFCRVHVYELDGKPYDRLMTLHSFGFRVLSPIN